MTNATEINVAENNIIESTGEHPVMDGDIDETTNVGEDARDLYEDLDGVESATVPVTQLPVDAALLRQIIEGAILAAGQPMTITRLLELFDEEVAPGKEDILAAIADIQASCEGRGFELKEVASGWRFQVRDNLAPWVNRLWEEKPQKYSRALLETLALIAYRQPITRGDIEEIRGVAVSSHIMKTLLERDWVKVVGHRDVPGRPSLFATTRQFLDYFNLKNLDELPSLSEIRDLDELNPVLDLGEAGLGEKDTDPPIPDENSSVNEAAAVIAEVADTETVLYEGGFVDGEDAFVDAAADKGSSTPMHDIETSDSEEEPRSN